MALTVNITKLAAAPLATPPLSLSPARDASGRFASRPVTPIKATTKATKRTKAPYRINAAGAVVPFNGGTILAVAFAPSFKSALIKAGLAA